VENTETSKVKMETYTAKIVRTITVTEITQIKAYSFGDAQEHFKNFVKYMDDPDTPWFAPEFEGVESDKRIIASIERE
jgi:hypothetical protein